jgi:Undecaprenyl-phosphate glucose phosphotransferase
MRACAWLRLRGKDSTHTEEARMVAETDYRATSSVPDLPSEKKGKAELNEMAKQVAQLLARDSLSPALVAGAVRASEFIGLLLFSFAILVLYLPDTPNLFTKHAAATAIGATLTVILAQALDAYQIATMRSFIGQAPKALAGFAMALTLLLVIGFITKSSADFSRFWLVAWFASGALFLVGHRLAVTAVLNRLSANGRLERRAVIVGGGKPAEDLIRSLEGQRNGDIRICGIFDDRDDNRSPPVVAGYPKLGTVPELVEFARVARLNMLIVSLPITAEQRVLQLLKKLWVLPVDIRLSAHANKLRFRPRSYSFEGQVPFFDVLDKPIADWDAITKRIFDLVVASAAIVVLAPLMLATALAIRLESKGPVLFRQKRYGFNNEIIEVLKFRSMYHEMADPEARQVVTKGDRRVTKVGRFIRKTSIDELPQLFNVLRGELSLVGPRPHAVNAHTDNKLWDEVVDGYFARHKVKPGVTGWAQVNGWRGEVDNPAKIRQRVDCDIYYIENWSIFLDLYILAITPFRLLNSENAY